MTEMGHSRRSGIGRESAYPPIPDIVGARSFDALCHFRTQALQQTTVHKRCLLDHIVGDREHVRRNCEGERLGGLQEQRPLRRAAWVARLRSRWNRQRGQGRHTPTSCGPLSFPTYPRRAASAVDQRVVQTKTRVSAPPLATLYTAAKNIIAARWHSAHRARRERGPSRQRPR